MTEIKWHINNRTDLHQKLLIERDQKKDQIEKSICEFFKIDRTELMSKSRKEPFPIARFICMDLFWENKLFFRKTKMAKYFNKDHTSVVYGLRKMSWLKENDKTIKSYYDNILNLINEKS